MATLLQQSGGARVEVVKPSLFSRRIEKVNVFVDIVCLYLRIKMIEESELTKMAWVLSYMQEGVAKAWKNNQLDELSKGESEIEIEKELFRKMRNKFGKTVEEKRKIE